MYILINLRPQPPRPLLLLLLLPNHHTRNPLPPMAFLATPPSWYSESPRATLVNHDALCFPEMLISSQYLSEGFIIHVLHALPECPPPTILIRLYERLPRRPRTPVPAGLPRYRSEYFTADLSNLLPNPYTPPSLVTVNDVDGTVGNSFLKISLTLLFSLFLFFFFSQGYSAVVLAAPARQSSPSALHAFRQPHPAAHSFISLGYHVAWSLGPGQFSNPYLPSPLLLHE